MRSTELRIGNYVHYEYKEMSEDMQVNMTLLYEVENYLYSSKVKPIPLTEEWLLKMGFEEGKGHGGYKAFSIDSFVVLKTNGVNKVFQASNYCANQVEVSTVHQLQNLYYALTGEELTIKE